MNVNDGHGAITRGQSLQELSLEFGSNSTVIPIVIVLEIPEIIPK